MTTCARTSSPCRASDVQEVVLHPSAPGHRPGMPTVGRAATGADHEQGIAVDHQLVGQVAHLALEPHVAQHRRDRRRRPRDVRRQGRQSARVDGADDDVGVELPRVVRPRPRGRRGRRRRSRPRRHDVDPAGVEPSYERLQQYAGPAGRGPGAEALLDVGREAGPRGHVAEVVAVDDEGVRRDQPRARVAQRSPEPLVQRLARVEPRRDLAGQARRAPRAPRGSHGAAPPSRRRTRSRGRARTARAPGPSVSNAWSCAARPTWRTRAEPSSNQCSRTQSSATSSSSFSRGRPVLRNRSRTTAGSSVWLDGVPREAVGSHRDQGAAERLAPRRG